MTVFLTRTINSFFFYVTSTTKDFKIIFTAAYSRQESQDGGIRRSRMDLGGVLTTREAGRSFSRSISRTNMSRTNSQRKMPRSLSRVSRQSTMQSSCASSCDTSRTCSRAESLEFDGGITDYDSSEGSEARSERDRRGSNRRGRGNAQRQTSKQRWVGSTYEHHVALLRRCMLPDEFELLHDRVNLSKSICFP